MKRNLFVILFITSGVFGADEIVSKEGESVSLRCSLGTSGALYWYRQYPNRGLQYLQYQATFAITELKLADSALYHCARRVGAQ
ncbi:hypothetical protein AOLI_G00113630 [Acnodon oligacanthus]